MESRDLEECMTACFKQETATIRVAGTQISLCAKSRRTLYVHRVSPSEFVALLHESGIDASYTSDGATGINTIWNRALRRNPAVMNTIMRNSRTAISNNET